MTDESGRRFHIERWGAVILALGSFAIINNADFGVCTRDAEATTCVVGNTTLTDTSTLFLAFTPLVFGPLVFLVAGLSPKWRQPLGLVSQVFIVSAGVSVLAAGLAFLGWGASVGGAVALLVGGAGIYVGMRSWRRQQAAD
jgi:hypothetical protein